MYDFIHVKDEAGFSYYGGNQSWFTSNTRARAGCGPVSGANVLLTLARRNPEIAEKLQIAITPEGAISKEAYMTFLDQVYTTMGTWEIPILRKIYDRCKRDNAFFKKVSPNNGRSICGYLKGVLKYARTRGIYLESHTLPTAHCDPAEAYAFIQTGLAKAGAVAMLTSYNKHPLTLFQGAYNSTAFPYQTKDPMQNHFVTITSLTDDNKHLYVSTWGRIAMIDYDSLSQSWNSLRALDSALFYFTPTPNPFITKKSLRTAGKVLRTALFHALFYKNIAKLPHTH